MTSVGRPTQTTPSQWSEAALDEIEEIGVRAMSVQSVARRLGVSKGGFYHHFADREALLRSALELWEQRFVVELGAQLEAVVDPRERLHAIIIKAIIELRPTVIVQLMAASEIPIVAEALRNAAQSRTAMLQRMFSELGLEKQAAHRRAVLAYASFLGFAQLRVQLPKGLATKASLDRYAEEFERSILAGL